MPTNARCAYNTTSLTPTSVDLPKLIKLKRVCELTSLSETHIWRLIREGRFPKPIPLTEKRVAWDEEEVIIWIRRRIRERKPIILVLKEEREAAAKRKLAKAALTTDTLKKAA